MALLNAPHQEVFLCGNVLPDMGYQGNVFFKTSQPDFGWWYCDLNNAWTYMPQRGPTGLQGPPGLDGIQFVGEWDTDTAYVSGNVVGYDGSSYVCVADNSGSPPPNTMYWGVLAERGATWWSGSGAPTLVVGSKAGDYYLDEDSGLVYVLS